jgi:hypothetical protein
VSRVVVTIAMAWMTSSCGDAVPMADAPIDPTADAASPDAMPATFPGVVSVTAGGGTASSAGYRIRIAIGAPQPMGTSSSASYRVRLGPISR